MRHGEKGVTTLGIVVSVGLAVLTGLGFWGAAQLLSSSENSGSREPTLLYSQNCIKTENSESVGALVKPVTGVPTSVPVRWEANLSIGLREQDYRADFNRDGDIDDIIKRRSTPNGNGGVAIYRSPAPSSTAPATTIPDSEKVILMLSHDASEPDPGDEIFTNKNSGCWGWRQV